MKVHILVTLDIDCGDSIGGDPEIGGYLDLRIRQAARQAMDNAINASYGEGFDHPLADEITVDSYTVDLIDRKIPTDWILTV